MKKRLTAMLLALIVCISIFPCTAWTVSAESILFDDAVGLMNAIGVVPTGKITEENRNSPISRIDFMIIMSQLLGYNEETASDRDYFYDIPADHWAKKNINAMVENNMISVGEHYLRPNDAITRAEAAKIVVTALGKQPEADLIGGYPHGYLSVADSQKLFKGISTSNELTYGDAVVLLYNASMEKITSITFKNNKMTLETSEDTILSLYHDIYFGEGFVNAVEGISIGNTVAPADQIVIGEEKFETENWYYDYLGLNVKYFYEEKDNGSRSVVFLMNENKDSREVITINSNCYNNYDGNYIYYRETKDDAKLRKIHVYPGATVIRNGEKVNTDMTAMLDKNNIYGTIRVVDTGTFDGADLIIIEDYENLIVSYIDEENKKLYFSDNASKTLTLNEDDDVFVKYFAADGSETDFSSIILGNLISVAVSSNGKCAIVRLSGKTVSGVVSGKGIDGDGEPYFIIDGVTYNAQSDFYNKNEKSISLGTSVNAGIDIFGNVAAFFSANSEDKQYACLINAYTSDDTERVVLRVYTAGGELINIPCADKIKIDNQVYTNPHAIIDYFSSLGEVQAQPIIFNYDSKGNIKNIDTTVRSASEGDNTLRRINDAEELYYHWTGLFSNVAYMPDNVPLMLVPPKKNIKSAYINDFAVKNRSVLTASKVYSIDLLTTDPDSRIPDIAICYNELMPEAADNTVFYVVEKITESVNEDGTVVPCLTLDNSGDSDYLVSADYGTKPMDTWKHVDPNTLTPGDIVRIGVNIIGEITDIKLVFDYSEAKNNTNETFFDNAINPVYALDVNSMVGANYDTVTGHGYVSKKVGNVFEWGFNSPHETNQLYSSVIQTNTLKVMVFDDKKKKDKCTNATTNDLVSYEESSTDFSKIVTMQKDKVLSKIVIYK